MYRMVGADGQAYGPVTAEELRRWVQEGRANADTRVAVEGSSDWRPLGTVPEFAGLFAAMPAPGAMVIPAGAAVRRTNAMAVAGFVCGLISLFLCWCCSGLPFNLLGLIFSIIALLQIRRQPERYNGQVMAMAGLVLSVLSILLAIALLVFWGMAGFWPERPSRTYRL